MAVQQTGSFGAVISSFLVRDIFRSTLSAFQQARRAVNDQRINSPRLMTEAFLNSKLANLKTLTQIDQVQKSKADLAVTTLTNVADDLDQLTQLAAAALNETDPNQRAIYQSQADSILKSIRGSLNTAVNNDPGLVQKTIVSSDGLVAGVRILRQDITLEDTGIDIEFDVTDIGTRYHLQRAILTDQGAGTAGLFKNDLTFAITGSRGTATFSVNAGDSVAVALEAINAQKEITGVFANFNDDPDRLDLIALDPGTTPITMVELTTDPNNELRTDLPTAGTALAGTVTIDGSVQTVTSTDGRTVEFDVGGISGIIDLQDPDIYIEALGTTTAGAGNGIDTIGGGPSTTVIKMFNGGRVILGDDGKLLGRVGISAFDYESLGRSKGGLDSIDLENDAGGAAAILAQAHLDLGDGIATASFIADGLLGTRITRNSQAAGNTAQALTELESVYEAIAMYSRITQEAKMNSSLALLSQLSQVFPVSSYGLL